MKSESRNLSIRTITKEDYPVAYAFQKEYLDQESYEDFIIRVENNPELYLAAFDHEELIGVCYGHPSRRMNATVALQGIAVSLDDSKGYARIGIGSSLLKVFEEIVIRKGYQGIDLGAADDQKVESFYLKNGYQPYELVVFDWDNKERDRIKVADYSTGLNIKQELREKYHPKEVIFIFHKEL